MPEEIPILREALNDVREELVSQNALISEQNQKLSALEDRAAQFVPKRRFWWTVGIVVVVVALVIVAGLVIRSRDHHAAAERRRDFIQSQEDIRQSAIRGCERSNDLRATLREVVQIAVASRPPPDGLSPELLDLYLQSQTSTTALRERLLNLPGVQAVDCEAQYPLLKEKA